MSVHHASLPTFGAQAVSDHKKAVERAVRLIFLDVIHEVPLPAVKFSEWSMEYTNLMAQCKDIVKT
jgi:hypothetical protein